MSTDITALFEPKSVAIIGASQNAAKIGHSLLNNVVKGGYTGAIYPVNPSGGEMLGHRVYESITEVPSDEPVDLAALAIPAAHAERAVTECAEAGVRNLMVITSGFSEVGNNAAERRIVDTAQAAGMRILGPNIFGIYSATASLNVTFGPEVITPGNVAIITQSGALGIGMIGRTAVEQIGLSAIVSVGNKADIQESDLLRYLVDQERTRVIMMYIEGVKDGVRFLTEVRAASRAKPVVVIKSGRSERGALAAASHTGSLAGSDAVFDALLAQAGALRADSIREAFDWSKFLASSPTPSGGNMLIVTNGGGIGVLATDAAERHGIELYDDADTTRRIFGDITPDFGSTKNPVDLTGGAGPDDYDVALEAACESPDIHAVMALYCETAVFDVPTLTHTIRTAHARYQGAGKPLLFSILGGATIDDAITEVRDDQIPVFPDVYDALSALGALYRWHRGATSPEPDLAPPEVDRAAIAAAVESARADNRRFLLSEEAGAMMAAAGIRTPKIRLARSIDQAVATADEIGYPVVMKVVSRDILHKSDVGGVVLDLDDADEVMDAYQAIRRNARTHRPDARIDGVEVAEMVSSGAEVIVGARRDPVFGPIVMFGLGGVYVEVLKDVAFRSYPADRAEVIRQIRETRSYPILMGVRGEKPRDLDAVVNIVLAVGETICANEALTDIEINPVVVYEEGAGARALDARILIDPEVSL